MTSSNPVIAGIERQRAIAETIQSFFAGHGINEPVKAEDLIFRSRVVVEKTANHGRLSKALLGAMFPSLPAGSVLLHYTSPDGLDGMLRSGELWLYPVRKRIDEAEVRTFAEKHCLGGYLDNSAGEPAYKELSDDLFYTSFTTTGGDEAAMWALFGRRGTGARITLRLTPEAPAELRTIQYVAPMPSLLNGLTGALNAAGHPPFLPWTISKIGAFYLPSEMQLEREARLLVKRHQGVQLPTCTDLQGCEYLPIPIGTANQFCSIELLEIEAGPAADQAALEQTIAQSKFSNLSLK